MSKLRIAVGRQSTQLIALATLCLSCLSGCGWAAHNQNVDGVRLYQQSYYPAAVQKFQQAIQSDPANADSYYNLAATLHREGKVQQRPADLAQAESYYHQCLDRDPNHKDCYRGLAVMLVEQGRSNDAFTLLEGWSQRNPVSPEPKIELARLFDEGGDRERAKAHLQEALVVAPNNPRALSALAKLREETGDPGQALANYQRSLAQNPYQPEVAARVAALQSSVGITAPATAPNGTRLVTNPASPGWVAR